MRKLFEQVIFEPLPRQYIRGTFLIPFITHMDSCSSYGLWLFLLAGRKSEEGAGERRLLQNEIIS